jgi:beta-lactamase class A
MKRRQFATAAALSCFSFALPLRALSQTLSDEQLAARLRELEARGQGRLGVHMLDTASGREFGYRSDERFMMLSTFKLLASALVLHRMDQGREKLNRRIPYTKEDLVSWSPVTEKHVGEGMTLAQLCEATITTSDNTAANLILKSYGGPAALTAFVRQLGDKATRCDRFETELNVRHATEPEMDTTTPRAMLHSMHKVALGDALSEHSRRILQQWLLNNTTGGKRLKAGIPANWRIGDKTGTNKTDANDIGIVWPANGKPVLLTAYLAESRASTAEKDDTIAQVGRLLLPFSESLQ